MKRLYFIFVFVALFWSNKLFAYDIAVTNDDGVTIYYNYINDGKELEVTKKDDYYKYKDNVFIPEEVTYMNRTRKVTSIGENAFSNCSDLTSVTIGNSVTSIGGHAFSGCNGLTSVTIGNSVTSIGNSAFSGCNGLTSVTIGNSVTSIGGYAFYGCSGLTSVTIPNSVTNIDEKAFSNCTGLTSVTIGNNVTTIWNDVFSGCKGLTTVHISDISAWCNIRFFDNSSNPLYFAHHLYMNGEEIKDLVIPNSVKYISNYTFRDCSGLTSVTIPNSVTSIGGYAFYGCTGLTSVTIPNSVTSIGENAFSNCSGLTSLTIPGNLKYASDTFPYSLDRLEIVKISVTNMSKFCQNNRLENLFIYLKQVFLVDEEGNDIVDLVITGDVNKITNNVISRCCNNFTSIKVEKENTAYDSRNNCNAIIETESNNLIAGCQNTIIPNDVTSIGGYAFYGCKGLTSVTIPNSVTSIGGSAFAGCTSIQYVKTYITEPYSISKNVFPDEVYRQSPLYIPAGTEKLYSRYDGWKEFLKIEEMDESEQPEIPGADKCATPTISYENGLLNFRCTTEGVEYKYKIEASDNKEGYGNGIKITKIYKVTVYAFKDGMNTSDPAIANITLASDGDMNGDGVVDAADVVNIVNIIMSK